MSTHPHTHAPGHACCAAKSSDSPSTVKDPVCGMSVDPVTAVHRVSHDDQDYFFCSAGCRTKFVAEPQRYLPLIGTLFLFLLVANWSSLIPGVEPPTATLETDAALALIVFGATLWFGVRALGPRAYLATFARPSILLAPLNIVELFTRSFSLMVRLFGNVMSGVFMIGVVLSLAGLLVPIPLMALEMLTGAVQAYIFGALAMVFIGSAISENGARPPSKQESPA